MNANEIRFSSILIDIVIIIFIYEIADLTTTIDALAMSVGNCLSL